MPAGADLESPLESSAAHDTAYVLNEALPYIRKFSGKTIVVKYGGHAMVDTALQQSFARNIALMNQVGIHTVVVHGGGPQIKTLLGQLGIETETVQGMRVTDSETMDVVEMVLGAKVNKSIVTLLNQEGCASVGLTGKDGSLISAVPMVLDSEVDLGQVGQVQSVNRSILETLREGGFTPVIAPIGVGADGRGYNINADLVAGAIASELNAEKLLLLTDTPGILDKSSNLLSGLKPDDIHSLIQDGTVYGGMLPKVQCALDAVECGVQTATILDGRVENAVLLELFTDTGIGTQIRSGQ